jgi:Rieske Fe-S protein
MPFPWSKKINRVIPVTTSVLPIEIDVSSSEVVQVVELPMINDKISVEEHKNGEQVVDARKEDDEDNEVQGDLQEGGRVEEGDYGGKKELEEARGS